MSDVAQEGIFYGAANATIGNVSAIPEPADVSMMLVGFGLVGGVGAFLRKKQLKS